MSKINRKTVFFAYFWYYGIILIVVVALMINALILYFNNSLIEYIKYAISFSLAIPISIMGIDYILASIFKWPHIALVDQLMGHRSMTSLIINWNEFFSKPYIIFGILANVLSIVIVIIAFFF